MSISIKRLIFFYFQVLQCKRPINEEQCWVQWQLSYMLGNALKCKCANKCNCLESQYAHCTADSHIRHIVVAAANPTSHTYILTHLTSHPHPLNMCTQSRTSTKYKILFLLLISLSANTYGSSTGIPTLDLQPISSTALLPVVADKEPEEWIDVVVLVLKASIMILIIVAAIFGNLLVIVSVMRNRKLRYPTYSIYCVVCLLVRIWKSKLFSIPFFSAYVCVPAIFYFFFFVLWLMVFLLSSGNT